MKFSVGVLTAVLAIATTTTSVSSFNTNNQRSIAPAFIQTQSKVTTTTTTQHAATCHCIHCVRSNNMKTQLLFMSTVENDASATTAETIDDAPAVSDVVPEAAATVTTTTPEVTTAGEATSDSDDVVPKEVLAMDGVQSETEAHNTERPARKSLIKKKPNANKGLPLTDFKVGDMVKAKAKSVAAYGAFMDIGAETDGLLHISNLSTEFVSSVKDIIDVNTEYDVRIISIDLTKKQVALSLLTEEQELQSTANAAASQQTKREPQQQRSKGGNNNNNNSNNNNNKKDDSAILQQLQAKGWDESQFVSGTVVSTVDFGAFVRVDASQFNPEVIGEFDGLVHISALAPGRTRSVSDVVKVGDTVQVRCTNIEQRKVSLTMVSEADMAAAAEARGSSGSGGDSEVVQQGNKEWKADMEKLQLDKMPTFTNRPLIVTNSRK